MNYLDPAAARAVWQRIAETLAGFPLGAYFSDVYFNGRVQHPAVIAFGALLSAFVKGRMHVHFKSPQELTQIMKTAGFKRVRAIKTDAIRATHEYSKQRGGDSVRVLEAWVGALRRGTFVGGARHARDSGELAHMVCSCRIVSTRGTPARRRRRCSAR